MAIRRTPATVRPVLAGRLRPREVNVRCPHCRSHYTHIRRVGTLVGTDVSEATPAYPGTEATGTTPDRRSALEVVFECECCPDRFALVIQQYKGVNRIEVHDRPGEPPATAEGPL